MRIATENSDSTDSSKSIQPELFNPNTFCFDHETPPSPLVVQKDKKHLATQIVKQDGNNQNNFLELIPDEIALSILRYLEFNDLGSLLLVNKKWRKLAQDITLWKRLFDKFTRGNLWRYLFKNPDITAYDTYFQEVFRFHVSSYKNLEENFTRLVSSFTSEDRGSKKNISIRKAYFKDLDIHLIKSQLGDMTQTLQKFSQHERQTYLTAFETKSDLSFEKYSKILVLLHRISLFDTLLTDLSYMNAFCISQKWDINWFCNERANVMLSPHAIVAISAYSNSNKILQTIFEESIFSHLRNRFTQTELLLCSDLQDTVIGEMILKDSSALNLLTDDDLITLMRLPLGHGVRTYFPSFMKDNSALLSRMHGSLLTKLVNFVDTYSSFILKDQNLLKLLSDEEVIAIAKKCLPDYFAEAINSETFFSFLEKKPTSFLMQLPLPEIIKNDRTANWLNPEEVLNFAKYKSISIGEAIAQQNILLQQFSPDQLLKLALIHPVIAIVMLKNEKLHDRWSYQQLDSIIKDNTLNKWKEEIHSLVHQRKEHLPQREKQLLPFHPQDPEPRVIHLIVVQTETPSVNKDMQNSRGTAYIPPPVTFNNTVKKQSSSYWRILGTVALILLAVTGIVLTATGIGAVAGVPIAAGVLASINILNVSVQALAVGSLIIGAVTTLTALTASTFLYCGNAIKNRFKGNFKLQPKDSNVYSSTYSGMIKKSLPSSSDYSRKQSGQHKTDDTLHYDSVFTKTGSKSIPRPIPSKLKQEDINYSSNKRWLSRSL